MMKENGYKLVITGRQVDKYKLSVPILWSHLIGSEVVQSVYHQLPDNQFTYFNLNKVKLPYFI